MRALPNMIKIEAKLFLRDSSTVIFGVLFPAGLLLGLGAIPALREPTPDSGGLRPIDIWAPTALVFGMVMIAVQHVPSVIATYRERGILRRLSTTPVHPRNILLAQMIVAFASVVVGAVLMILLAWAVLDIAPPERPLEFAVAFIVGYAAVLGISMICAAVVRTSSSATQIGTLLFVALMFFGGAFLPRLIMPEALFRVAQESLTNVAKHAGASRVGVTLSYSGTEVLLDVRDDGRGFANEVGVGFGLTSMRQRIRGVGGHVEVQSAPGEGTSVSARVPAIARGETSTAKETDR